MKRTLILAAALLLIGSAALAQLPSTCYLSGGGTAFTCQSGSTVTLSGTTTLGGTLSLAPSSLALGAATAITGSYDFTAGTAGTEAGTGNVAVERCMGAICQTTMTLTAVSVTITDPGGAAGYGGIKLYDFPAGWIYRMGVVADLAITAGAGGIADNFDGDVAFGGTVSGGGGMAADEVSWVASTATPQATGGVTTADCQSTATEHTIGDGHTTALDLYLNFEVDDADITAGDTLAVTGTVTVTWINLGDN